MRSTKYTKELLAPLVASSHSLAEVIRKLGLQPTGGNYRFIKARILLADVDTSHFRLSSRARIAALPEAQLRELVAQSTSIAQVLAALGLPTMGRDHHELTSRLKGMTIDLSHFTGSGWSKGHTAATHPGVARAAKAKAISNEEVFIERSLVINNGPNLVKRLLAMGWEYCCSECGISEWRGKRLVLHLDHKNGIANDNRLVNLRLLCPNCHSQTETYCNRPKPRRTSASEPRGSYTCYTFPASRACWNW